MDVTVALNRRYIGESVAVPGLEDLGLKVRPRKFSVRGRDELNAALLPRQALVAKVRRAQDLASQAGQEMDLSAVEPSLFGLEQIMRLQLRHGIAFHNFDGAEKAPDDVWLSSVLEDPDLAGELIKIVQGYNNPLPKPTPEPSGMSSNGSSEEPASAQT
jgi:hypothetical protein